jgi:hypothetical protein
LFLAIPIEVLGEPNSLLPFHICHLFKGQRCTSEHMTADERRFCEKACIFIHDCPTHWRNKQIMSTFKICFPLRTVFTEVLLRSSVTCPQTFLISVVTLELLSWCTC